MIVTLCGSMKFKPEINKAERELTLKGFTVFTPVMTFDKNALTDTDMNLLRETIEKKIDASDILFVLNKDNYIGESVKSEILYAIKHHKWLEFYISVNIPVRKLLKEYMYLSSAYFNESSGEYVCRMIGTDNTFTTATYTPEQLEELIRRHINL